MTERTNRNRLMQFLMGLNERFDQVRNQILLLDSLPSVNKAYSMVLRVESQRMVSLTFADMAEGSAFLA